MTKYIATFNGPEFEDDISGDEAYEAFSDSIYDALESIEGVSKIDVDVSFER